MYGFTTPSTTLTPLKDDAVAQEDSGHWQYLEVGLTKPSAPFLPACHAVLSGFELTMKPRMPLSSQSVCSYTALMGINHHIPFMWCCRSSPELWHARQALCQLRYTPSYLLHCISRCFQNNLESFSLKEVFHLRIIYFHKQDGWPWIKSNSKG